jgi:WD40 repeat protein
VDWETGEELNSFMSEPNNLAVSTEGTVAGTYQDGLMVWGPELNPTHSLDSSALQAWTHPALTADGSRLSVSVNDAENDPMVQVWNLQTEEVEFEFATDGYGNEPAINADGTLLYADETTDGSTATVWDLTTEEVVMEFPNDDFPDVPMEEGSDWPDLRYTDFHPTDPSVLAVKTSHNDLALYDFSTGEILRLEAPEPEQEMYEIHFSADGSRLAAGGGTESDPPGGHVWDTATGDLLTDEPVEVYSSLAFHPDGEVIVSLTPRPDNDRFIVLDGETFEIRHEFPG